MPIGKDYPFIEGLRKKEEKPKTLWDWWDILKVPAAALWRSQPRQQEMMEEAMAKGEAVPEWGKLKERRPSDVPWYEYYFGYKPEETPQTWGDWGKRLEEVGEELKELPDFFAEKIPEEVEKYKAIEAPTYRTGRYLPEQLGGEEITLGVKGATELLTELPLYIMAEPLMPLRLFTWSGRLARVPGAKALLPQALQVAVAPAAGVQWALQKGIKYGFKGLVYPIKKALERAGLYVQYIDAFVARKTLQDGLKALNKQSAGKALTRNESDALAKLMRIHERQLPAPKVGIPTEITQAEREQLREMGYSRIRIEKMTPVEAYEIFGKPLPIPKAEVIISRTVIDATEDATEIAASKLITAVKKSKPLLGLQKEAVEALRKVQAAGVRKAFEAKTGRDALKVATASLKRRAPVQPLPGSISEQFIGEEVDLLMDAIRVSRAIPDRVVLTRRNTMDALEKLLLLNELPTRGELRLLERVFGEELSKAILGKRPFKAKAWEAFLDSVNLPKAAMASWDFSATLRQGGVLFWGHLKQTVPAIKPQIQTFFEGGISKRSWLRMSPEKKLGIVKGLNLDDRVAQKTWEKLTRFEKTTLQERFFSTIDDAIRASHYAPLREESRLYLADIRGVSPALWELEENFMSRFAKILPLVRRSERAYVMYLNKIRADVFDSIVGKWEQSGVNVWKGKGLQQCRDLATYINYATGRGSLGDIKQAGLLLNALMFSPRLQTSRMLLPLCLVSGSPAVRKIAAKDLSLFLGVNSSIASLLWLSGIADIELNPRSTDFGKIRIGNTRIEFWAGYQPYVRFMTQLITGSRKTISGRYQQVSRWELIERFLMTKRSPAAGMVMDLLAGRTFLGEEINELTDAANEVLTNFAPLFVQDVFDAVKEEGLVGGFIALPGAVGAGVQSYDSSQQVVGEVYYAASQHQDMQRRVREWIEEGKIAQARKYVAEHPEARWTVRNGQIFSGTGQQLAKITRELARITDERDETEKRTDLDKDEQQQQIEEYNRKLIDLAVKAMLAMDKLEYVTKTKAAPTKGGTERTPWEPW